MGLARKDLLLIHEKGKCPKDGSGPGAGLLEGGQGLNKTGRSVAEPSLKQHQPNSPRTGLETGSRIGPNLFHQAVQQEWKSIYVNPRPWKHQSSHPLDQILSDINMGVQTRSKLKNYCAFYAFFSTIEPKNINETLADSDWVTAMQEELD